MYEVDCIKGIMDKNKIEQVFLRNSEIKIFEGKISLDEINDIICIDIDVNIKKINKIEFKDLNLINIFANISFNIFIEDNKSQCRFISYKRNMVINKKVYEVEKRFDLYPIDSFFILDNNYLEFSLVLLLVMENK